MVSLLFTSDMVSSETVVLAMGRTVMIGDMKAGFGTPADITVTTDGNLFFISSSTGLRSTAMQEMKSAEHPADSLVPLMAGTVYTAGSYRIMPRMMTMSGAIVPSVTAEEQSAGGALEFSLKGDGFQETIWLWDDEGEERSEWSGDAGRLTARVSYGASVRELPFSLRLDDFIVEHYPGSNSPSGFTSRVILSDPEHGTVMPYDIYMNHILIYPWSG